MNRLPPLDVHAHVNPKIDELDLDSLNAAVFAVSRSLDEAASAVERTDRLTVWGVGCHPGLAEAEERFSADRFSSLLDRSALAGELGLDGKSPVPLAKQQQVLRAALKVLQDKPRLVSLHSFRATEELITELETTSPGGVVLHWWLGNAEQTKRAIRLGACFSVNSSSVRRRDILQRLPLDRVLTETDHPYGNHHGRGRALKQPGFVGDVEAALAEHYATAPGEIRTAVWRNMGRLVADTRCSRLLPRSIRSHLAIVT